MGYIGAGVTRFNTADELTVTGDAQIDTTTLVVDSTNNRVGIGTASPATALDVTGTVTADDLTVDASGGGLTFSGGGNTFISATSSPLIFQTSSGTERMRITGTGGVGIGTSTVNSDRDLHLHTNDSGSVFIQVTNSTTGTGSTDGLIVGVDASENALLYHYENKDLYFGTNSTERMRIDSSGNLLVGGTSLGENGAVTMGGDGRIYAIRASDTAGFFGRTTTDGSIVNFTKDGSTVGSISTTSGDIEINSASGNSKNVDIIGRDSGGNARGIAVGSGSVRPNSDNAIDLGTSSNRFQDLYLSGGAYLGGTGSANHLDDYEEGSFSPTVLGTGGSGTFTYNQRNGRYVKVGNQVTIHIYLEVNITVAGSGSLRIDDLPFNGHGSVYQAISTAHDTLSSSNAGAAFVQPSADFMEFTDGGTTSRRGFPGTGTKYIFVGGTYLTQF